jgi:phage virion morphogenesis protein
MSIEIVHNAGEITAALNRLLARSNDLTEPMRAIAAVMESATEEAFANQADPATGVPWAPLSDTTKTQRSKQGSWPGQVLQVSGGLAASIESQSDSHSASIGTNKIYAPVHFFGASKGEFGNGAPWGDIPARPFLGLSADDESSILDILDQFLADGL